MATKTRSARLGEFDTSRLSPHGTAVFLDLDGTLAPIAAHPHDVSVAAQTKHDLSVLDAALGGALAIVSGRSVEDIDKLMAPCRFAVAGIHGLVRRDINGRTFHGAFDPQALETIIADLGSRIAELPGVWLETKPGSLALHYRQNPAIEEICREQVSRSVARHAPAEVLAGKMVIEVKMSSRTKGDAVRDFMAEPPFRDRLPIYAGDDVTDQDGFRAVAGLGGCSIRVGRRDLEADYRTAGTAAFLRWLHRLSVELAARRAPADQEESRT